MQSRNRRSWGWWVVSVAAIAIVAAGLVRGGDAKEDERVTLLVKCRPETVSEVLARLADSDVEIWDTRTMKSLRPEAPRSPSAQTPATQSPGLRDAHAALLAIFEIVDSARTESADKTIELEAVTVQSRRAMFKLTFGSVATADRVRTVVESHPWFREHATELGVGALQRLSNGGHRTSYTLKLRSRPARVSKDAQLPPLADVQRMAQGASLDLVYAGAERADPNRGRGVLTRSREFTLNGGTLPQLIKFLGALSENTTGATITEVRFKRAEAKARAEEPQRIMKPTVRVAVLRPLP